MFLKTFIFIMILHLYDKPVKMVFIPFVNFELFLGSGVWLIYLGLSWAQYLEGLRLGGSRRGVCDALGSVALQLWISMQVSDPSLKLTPVFTSGDCSFCCFFCLLDSPSQQSLLPHQLALCCVRWKEISSQCGMFLADTLPSCDNTLNTETQQHP